MKSIGIDISKNGLTIVEVHADRNSYEIVSGHYHAYSQQEDSDWELETLQVLKQMGSDFDFENSTISVSIDQHLSSVRNLTFPFDKRINIMKSLPFELDEDLPMDISDGVFDSKITGREGVNTSVLAYAVPMEVIQEKIDYFKRVNVDPDIVSVESSAFANIYEDWAEGSFLSSAPESMDGEIVMRLYIRRDTTLVSAFKGQQMIWSRNVSWGERNLISELVATYNLPYSKAAELIPESIGLLVVDAGASTEELQMSDTIVRGLQPLIHSLKLMTIDLEDRFQSSVTKIILIGTVASTANINAYLTKSVGVACSIESVNEEIFQARQINSIAPFSEQALVAIGLALEAFKRPKNPAINFRQGDLAKKNQFFTKAWDKWGYAATLCTIAYVFFIAYGFTREQLTKNLDDASYTVLSQQAQKIAGMKGSQATPAKISRYIRDEESKIKKKKIFAKVQEIDPAAKMINKVSQVLPSNIKDRYDIRSLKVNKAILTIQGEARRPTTINTIKNRLKTLARDNNVKSIPPTIPQGSGKRFAFVIRLKR